MTSYSECVPLIYRLNTFSFTDLFTFDIFTHATLLSRLSLIRSLDIAQVYPWLDDTPFDLMYHPYGNVRAAPPRDLHTWQQTWKAVSRLPALKELRVTLVWLNMRPWRPRARNGQKERDFLAPLRLLGKMDLDVFVVRVNWDGERFGDVPFSYLRDRF